MTDTDPRFPIGEFTMPGRLDPDERARAIEQIAEAPGALRRAVESLSEEQLDTPYRPDGWTVRQVVHHLPDSHINSYMRLKLALTEDTPTIRTYEEARWAELPDSVAPVELSLALLERLHDRWVHLWRSLSAEDWDRELHHPDLGKIRVDELAALYAWHGRHHIAHIAELRQREKW